jgi:hypothetical protein
MPRPADAGGARGRYAERQASVEVEERHAQVRARKPRPMWRLLNALLLLFELCYLAGSTVVRRSSPPRPYRTAPLRPAPGEHMRGIAGIAGTGGTGAHW